MQGRCSGSAGKYFISSYVLRTSSSFSRTALRSCHSRKELGEKKGREEKRKRREERGEARRGEEKRGERRDEGRGSSHLLDQLHVLRARLARLEAVLKMRRRII